jgi:Ca2+-binding RTX toxin-like protein
VKDLHNGKTVARLAKQAGEFVVDKAGQAGNWTREKTNQFGDFVEEQYEKGKENFEKVATKAWRTLENGAEEFVEGGKTLIRQGEKLTEIAVNGAVQIWNKLDNGAEEFIGEGKRLIKEGEKLTEIAADGGERVWDGAKTTYKKGKETFEWIGGKLKSFSDSSGKLFRLNEAGEFVDNVGEVSKDIGGAIEEAIGGISLGLTDGGNSNQAPARPEFPEKPKFPTRPSSGITYRPDGSIFLQTGIGADVLEGTSKGDELKAGAGNDYVSGNEGDDTLFGEAGNDVLVKEAKILSPARTVMIS